MRTLRPILLSVLFIAGCSAGTSTSGRYTGPAPPCGRNEGGGSVASLTRAGAGFAFAPYDGSLVVNGSVAPDGTASGSLALRPADAKRTSGGAGTATPAHAPQALSVRGTLTGDTATLSYAAPGCAARLMLTRVHPPLL